VTADRSTLPFVVPEADALKDLQEFASAYRSEGIAAHGAILRLDESQDGEPVVRILLLLDDPADETWDLDQVIALRRALGNHAGDVGLPPVSVTLVAKSGHAASEFFG